MLEVGDVRDLMFASHRVNGVVNECGGGTSALHIRSFNHMSHVVAVLEYCTAPHSHSSRLLHGNTRGMNILYFSYLSEDAPITAPCSLRCKWRLPRNPSGGETAQPPPELLLYLTVPTHVF
jgi:hypothetical protein